MNSPLPTTPVKTITIGHTPDADDAFMYYGFAHHESAIPDHEIQQVVEDIQILNQKALKHELDMTAISAAVYPAIQDHYWILPVGASVGRNYGPVIVKRAGEKPTGNKLGIPGIHTTAALLAQILAPGYQPIPYRFDEIPQALLNKEIDYGLLIHEVQLTYHENGFEKVADLGELWMKETQLPIPLGLDVVKKSLGEDLGREIGRAFQKSILAAYRNQDLAVDYALRFGRGIPKILGRTFIDMYVNSDTLQMSTDTEKALSLLFDKAYRLGLSSSPTKVDILHF